MNFAPVVQPEIMDQYPEIADILNPVFLTLDNTTLQTLNNKHFQGQDATEVAREYLISKGFLTD